MKKEKVDRVSDVENNFNSFQSFILFFNDSLTASVSNQGDESTGNLITYNIVQNYENKRKEITITKTNSSLAISALGAFYVYNLIDAYFFSGIDIEDKKTKKDSSLNHFFYASYFE